MPKRLEYEIINVYFTIHTLSHIPNLKKHLPKKKRKIFVPNYPICVKSRQNKLKSTVINVISYRTPTSYKIQ